MFYIMGCDSSCILAGRGISSEMDVVMETLKERVENGAKYMDTYAPADWRDRIDRKRLDISDYEDCVVGQIFGTEACVDLLADRGEEWAVENGFQSPDVLNQEGECFEPNYSALNRAWRGYLN